jgi:hypothetical protein
MSTRTILLVGGAVAVVVGLLIFRGAKANPTFGIGANLVNGLGRLTAQQRAQIIAKPTTRSGVGHF